MITIENLSHQFDDRIVLDNFNLQVPTDSFHSILGLNGAGKSLTLRLISGLEKMQSGSLEVEGKISFVFQKAIFFPWLTIQKNLKICSHLTDSQITEHLRLWNLDGVASMLPRQLSGGTLQKINLLRAFIQKADLVLMDEPFVHLDIVQKEEMYKFTKNLFQEYKSTVILVTHDIDEAIYLSQSISYLSKKTKNIVSTVQVEMEKSSDFYKQRQNSKHIFYLGIIEEFLRGDS